MRLRSLCLLAICLAIPSWAQYPGAESVRDELKPGWDSIMASDAKAWLTMLSSKEFAGRGTGQPGYQKAADFVAGKFKEWGLKPVGKDGTYFQPVPFLRTKVVEDKTYFEIEGKAIRIGAGKGLSFRSATGSGDISGDLVLLRVRGENPTLPTEEQLKGKLVIVDSPTVPAALRRLLFSADATGITVGGDGKTSEFGIRRAGSGGPSGPGRSLRTAQLTKAAYDQILKGLGKASGLKPVGENASDLTGLGAKATLKLEVTSEEFGVPNVVGAIEGSDPTLKAETVGLGAHLDHLGVTADGTIYPGADDDGSGTTALLLIARAMAKSPLKPKRTVIFMAFTGEEMGLIGSGYYTQNPIFPLDKMTCLLQMDMVGRNEEKQGDKPEENVDTIHLVGSKRISAELHQEILDANKMVNFKFEWDEEGVYTRSDHYMFAAKGVPIAFLFSGFHPDYHQPSDTIEKINFDKIISAARLFYSVAMSAANRGAMYKRDASPGGGS
ncbi:MAG TPA: M20/M25/M40 family metallo-hydrolase [Fimbriimonadaceae bacterium]|nr:M20/M25/M40 family metallo-hydrolase [Fimbriimonadaceae bacterium]